MADSSYMSTTRTTVSPAFMISTSSESSDGDAKSDKIVFGGKGTGIGKFKTNSGVVVSTNNEIFVTDMHNRRVQIFTIDGAFLGNFSTVVPGENDIAMLPYDIAIDGKANLWVVGKHIYVNEKPVRLAVYVVKYNRDGLPRTKFDIPYSTTYWLPTITVDTRRDKIIVVDKGKVFTYAPESYYQRSEFTTIPGYLVSYVTVDLTGNILLTYDYPRDYGSVHVYSRNGDGQLLFKFGTKGNGQLRNPKGICVDPTSGNILVANRNRERVDMFTSSGVYVRTVVEAPRPGGIALGPDGHLVVNTDGFTVTVFPQDMWFLGMNE
ncbi:PREDICTED: tripartite motif-containing protein 3-like [Branchiostoma belcheri]|uniref:Tripartite motif-containing protein 3-like n=1 Tax=Branchiostoma belcheri TaxID=7741 RepID=A0A6P4YSH1_BRABE|nr:PREDICTED: tripartite motif-containing protein 3-like [Branchiostoma belcheri]